jgi:hypothetical protein
MRNTAALRHIVVGTVAALVPWTPPARADEAFFERKIRPVLAGTCFRCHGGERVAGKLRVDSRATLLEGGASGPAIVPGEPDRSRIVRALCHADGVAAMPPGKRLADTVVQDFTTWIRGGAEWPKETAAGGFRSRLHWAFQPIRVIAHPADLNHHTASPIDRFLAVKQREHGLTPVGPADRRTLVRRMTFDLTGLPPSPEDIEAFVNDTRPDAYDRLVERLLASPAYGEKWARHWLDLVRYADTAGETADFPVPDAWRYRYYVIRAFNHDLPYDRFLHEQLAGDILARQVKGLSRERHTDLIVATGYLATSRRFGYDIVKDHFLTLEDTIDVLGKSLLGLTIGCARCHDHKYDPISSADYYALYGIFDSTRFPFSGCEKDRVPRDFVPLVPPDELAARLRTFDDKTLPKDQAKKKLEDYLHTLPTAYAVAEGKPHDVPIHRRGDPDAPGKVVPRRNLDLLGGERVPSSAGSGRLELARWLTDGKNPLTARVMINRIWQHHFGAGLVTTPSDFGTRGSPPSHPELLDWLASRFVASGWSIKTMHRLIVHSEAYRRDSRASQQLLDADPANVYLSRFSRRRLSAEEIRDAVLAVSGDLDRTTAGPHPFPPAASWRFTQHAPFQAVYDHQRRSIYLMTQRIRRHPFLGLFDGPDGYSSTAQRHATTVPTQALFFLNDPFIHTRAASLAGRLASLPDDTSRHERLAQLLFGRSATAEEQALSAKFREEYGGKARAPIDAEHERASWAAWVRVMMASNEFLYVD